MRNKRQQLKRPVRICLVSPKSYPLFNRQIEAVFGGAEVDLYHLGTELAKDNDFQVSCIVADYAQPPQENIEGVNVIKSMNFSQNPFSGLFKLWRSLKLADADMYMIKSVSPGIYVVKLFCSLKKRKFIYRTAHQTHCNGEYIRKHPVLGKMFRRLVKHSDIVFTQNQSDRKDLKRTTGADSIVIPNAHPVSETKDIKRSTILWVGRSADFKRPEMFIELASKFPDENFVMICQKATGDKDFVRLRQLTKKTTNLRFYERIGFHEIDKYFQQAKIFVNTSDSEGFPNTFIQAAKAAVPILSYKVNPDNFLTQYNCGIDCEGDFQAMVNSLSSLLENDSYIQMGRNAISYFQDKHNIEEVIEEYKKLFKTIINSEG